MPIRIAGHRDTPQVLDMMRAFYVEDGLRLHEAAGDALGELLGNATLGIVLLDEDAGQAVGYSVVTLGFSLELGGRDAFVDELYVAPSHRRQGRGAALLSEAQAWARGVGVRVIHLEVAAPDEGKLRLYAAAGFVPRPHPLMVCWLG